MPVKWTKGVACRQSANQRQKLESGPSIWQIDAMKVLETFELERGLVVAVAPLSRLPTTQRLEARITRDDGTVIKTTAYKERLLIRDPKLLRDGEEAFLLHGMTKANVPVGSEIIIEIAPAALAKALSANHADKYRALGWTLKYEFRAQGDDEPYEYVFEWQLPGEPVRPS